MSTATVVIAIRNRCDRLRDCLTALLALPDRIDTVVVDNGSDDNTSGMVRLRFPSVLLISLPRNQGAVARNIGVQAARTPVVAFADDDSGWEPGSLTIASRLMGDYPRLGLIAARALVGPERRVDPLAEHMATAPLGHEPDLPGPSVLGFLACAAVVRREAFLQTGGFDPVVFFMGEEERVAYDLARLGWGLSYCPQVVAHHLPVSVGVDPHKRALGERNLALTSWMRRPVRTALRHSARAVAASLQDGRSGSLWALARRVPAALARRVPPTPMLEAQLRRLERGG